MAHKQVLDTWERGSPYEQYVGRWSRRVAPLFLSWLSIPAGRRWLDVGCGTGALCAAIVDRCSPSSVAGVEPSEGFLRTAKENLAGRVVVHQGSATTIPLGDASVDVVVSGLVLNFVPDPQAALAEMTRVAAKGGTIPHTSGITPERWSSCGISGTQRSSSIRAPRTWTKAAVSRFAGRRRSRSYSPTPDWKESR